jgi:hypothetical protein
VVVVVVECRFGKGYGDPAWMSLFVCCFLGGCSISLFQVLLGPMVCDYEAVTG